MNNDIKTTKKIYCRQIPPEYQESPLFVLWNYNEVCKEISVYGNTRYKGRTTDAFNKVKTVLDQGELAYYLENKDCMLQYWKNKTQCIMEYLPPCHKSRYSTQEIHKLCELIDRHCTCRTCEEDDILCSVLKFVTGKTYNHKEIHGSSQSDWNHIYYPVDEYDRKAINHFECEYFNEGSEWIVDDEYNFNPETDDPSDINGCSFYSHEWRADDIRKEIADSFGVPPEDVVLYEHDGYIKISKYKVVA